MEIDTFDWTSSGMVALTSIGNYVRSKDAAALEAENAELRAKLAAAEARTVPDGWQLAPKHINYKMKSAAKAYQGCAPWVIYEAMIAASPKPPNNAILATSAAPAVQNAMPVPGFIADKVRQAIHSARNPIGMHTNGPCMASVEVTQLERLLLCALSGSAAPAAQEDAKP